MEEATLRPPFAWKAIRLTIPRGALTNGSLSMHIRVSRRSVTFSVLMLHPNAAEASRILNRGYLRSGPGASSEGGVNWSIHPQQPCKALPSGQRRRGVLLQSQTNNAGGVERVLTKGFHEDQITDEGLCLSTSPQQGQVIDIYPQDQWNLQVWRELCCFKCYRQWFEFGGTNLELTGRSVKTSIHQAAGRSRVS